MMPIQTRPDQTRAGDRTPPPALLRPSDTAAPIGARVVALARLAVSVHMSGVAAAHLAPAARADAEPTR